MAKGKGLYQILSTVAANADKHSQAKTWQDKPDWFWLVSLLEEVGELALALIGLHRHTPEVELTQIAGICINWIEKRSKNG